MSTPDDSLLTRARVRFSQPASLTPDPLDPAVTTLSQTPPSPMGMPAGGGAAAAGAASGPSPEGPRSADTPDTARSSTSERRPRRVPKSGEEQESIAVGLAEALVGLLEIGIELARLLLRSRRIEVVRMTEPERQAIADPLSRIGARHLDLDLAPNVLLDIGDAGKAVGATVHYLEHATRRPAGGELRPTPEGTSP